MVLVSLEAAAAREQPDARSRASCKLQMPLPSPAGSRLFLVSRRERHCFAAGSAALLPCCILFRKCRPRSRPRILHRQGRETRARGRGLLSHTEASTEPLPPLHRPTNLFLFRRRCRRRHRVQRFFCHLTAEACAARGGCWPAASRLLGQRQCRVTVCRLLLLLPPLH